MRKLILGKCKVCLVEYDLFCFLLKLGKEALLLFHDCYFFNKHLLGAY